MGERPVATAENQAVIEPRRGKREELLPSRAILAFTPQDVELVQHQAPLLRQGPQGIYLTKLFVGSCRGVPLVLAGPMLGAPQAVLVLEKMIALGVDEVIAAGWCGSLQPQVEIGHLVLPTGAFSEEGTSAHYPIATPRPGPSPELLAPLQAALRGQGGTVHQGMVWSTDAPFRETVGKVMQYQKAGVLAVEMEMAAMFTVAVFRRVRLAAVLAVSDDLSALAWVHGFRHPAFRKAREGMIEAIITVVSREQEMRG